MSTFLTLAGSHAIKLRAQALGEKLPYAGHIDPETVALRDGRLMQIIKLGGYFAETADNSELNYRQIVRETLLRGAATSSLSIYHHVVRRPARPLDLPEPAAPFARDLDQSWRQELGARRLHANDLYLTLVNRPLQGAPGFLTRWIAPEAAGGAAATQAHRDLSAIRDTFLTTLAPYGARALSLVEHRGGLRSEPAEFLSSLLNAFEAPVLAPTGDLGSAIGRRRIAFGGDALEWAAYGDQPTRFGAIISLKDYPARSHPGMLDGVLRLPFELTLAESFSFVDRQATLERMGTALRRLRAARDDAPSVQAELMHAKDDAGAGRAAYGEHHLTLAVRASSLPELDEAVAQTMGALNEIGAIAVREDLNLAPAFFAQFPGNLDLIARKALISTANFASLASLHDYPGGCAQGAKWGGAVATLETTSSAPYAFGFHHGDLGNFTLIGPSGSGKTALLAFLIAQADRYKPRVIFFDKDRGAEVFIRAMGGRYEVLQPGTPTGLNPLLLADTGENRAFLVDWLEALLTSDSGGLTSDERSIIADGVEANFDQAPALRRLGAFRDLLRGSRRPAAGDLFSRLSRWCSGGEYAFAFDNAEDHLDLSSRVAGFDMTRFLDVPQLRTPLMMYLFHRVEERLEGTPAIVVVDEGWKALDDDFFVRRLQDWEKTIRKKNGIVGFATQNASDALASRISSTIIEQTACQIFFPNPKASEADYMGGFGLTRQEFELVRTLPDTARCFLIKKPDHSVVARLDLTHLGGALRVLAGDELGVRRLGALRRRLGDAPGDWLEPFMAGET